MALKKTKYEPPREIAEMVQKLEDMLSENGYVGMFEISGINTQVNEFYFDGDLHTIDENEWFLIERVVNDG